MTTDAIRARLYNKKLLDYLTVRTNLLDYLVSEYRGVHQDVYSSDGVLGFTATTVAPGSNNRVDIAAASAINGVSGDGKRFRILAADSRLQGVWIPPDAGVVYHVGLEQTDVEDGIEVNPRTGQFEYIQFKESLGRVTAPTSVTDNGNGTLTINVNSLGESGKDYSGRTVRVWLKSRADGGIGPLASSAAVAFQDIAVSYSAPNNTILVPNLIGQTTASTTAADYKVMMIGPVVKRAGLEDLRATAGCLFLAAVTSVAASNPIVTISTTDQFLINSGAASISYGGGGTWADGTTNPATTVEAQLDKIISDLSPTTGGAKIGGAASGTDIAAANLNTQIADLAVNWGKLSRANTWALGQTFTSLITANAGLTAGANQHITVSGSGRHKHGTLTICVPIISAGLFTSAPDDKLVITSPNFAYIPFFGSIPIGKRFVKVRCTVSHTAGTTAKCALRRSRSDGSSATFGLGSASSGSGSLIESASLIGTGGETAASGDSFGLHVEYSAGSANITIRGVEFDFDDP